MINLIKPSLVPTIIFISCIFATYSQELLPIIQCSLVPYQNKSSSGENTLSSGYTYSCELEECIQVKIPKQFSQTANVFATEDECSSTCNCMIRCFFWKLIIPILDKSVTCLAIDSQLDPEIECRKSTVQGYEESGFCYIGFSTWWTYDIVTKSCHLYTFRCGELPSENIYENEEECKQFCSGV